MLTPELVPEFVHVICSAPAGFQQKLILLQSLPTAAPQTYSVVVGSDSVVQPPAPVK